MTGGGFALPVTGRFRSGRGLGRHVDRRSLAAGDLDPARLQRLGHLAHEIDMQQTVGMGGLGHAHVVGQMEPTVEGTGRDPAMQVDAVAILLFRLAAADDQRVLAHFHGQLIRAEARNEMGNTAGAVADVNVVRARVDLDGMSASSQQDFRDKLVAATKPLQVGDPKDEDTFVGPIIAERVEVPAAQAAEFDAWRDGPHLDDAAMLPAVARVRTWVAHRDYPRRFPFDCYRGKGNRMLLLELVATADVLAALAEPAARSWIADSLRWDLRLPYVTREAATCRLVRTLEETTEAA